MQTKALDEACIAPQIRTDIASPGGDDQNRLFVRGCYKVSYVNNASIGVTSDGTVGPCRVTANCIQYLFSA